MTETQIDRTFVVTGYGAGHADQTVEVEARDHLEALVEGTRMIAAKTGVASYHVHVSHVAEKPEPERFCGACGEPEGSDYAKPCCSDDAMIEA